MSLKAFHIVFVTLSMLLSVGFGIWSLVQYRQTSTAGMLAMGVGGLIVAVFLIVYGVWFLRKLKHVSFQ